MKIYVVSLCCGVIAGVVYSLLNVHSPAPPVVALVGLAGILIGEQVIPIGKQVFAGKTLFSACVQKSVLNHLFGQLPGRQPSDETNRTLEETRS